jgi:hypothetical protein
MVEFQCTWCERVFKTPGGRGSHERVCVVANAKKVLPVTRKRKAVEQEQEVEEEEEEEEEEDVFAMGPADEEYEDQYEDMDQYFDAVQSEEEAAWLSIDDQAMFDDANDGVAPSELHPAPVPESDATALQHTFYDKQLRSGGARIQGPLARVTAIPPAILAIAKTLWNPLVNLSTKGCGIVLELLKNPLFNSSPSSVPSMTTVAKELNSAVTRDKDPHTRRKKTIDVSGMGFPARFKTMVFAWTCIISLCVELLLDPRISKPENMQFSSTHDGVTYGELPSGAWWAGEQVCSSCMYVVILIMLYECIICCFCVCTL